MLSGKHYHERVFIDLNDRTAPSRFRLTSGNTTLAFRVRMLRLHDVHRIFRRSLVTSIRRVERNYGEIARGLTRRVSGENRRFESGGRNYESSRQ